MSADPYLEALAALLEDHPEAKVPGVLLMLPGGTVAGRPVASQEYARQLQALALERAGDPVTRAHLEDRLVRNPPQTPGGVLYLADAIFIPKWCTTRRPVAVRLSAVQAWGFAEPIPEGG